MLEPLEAYFRLLTKWNATINLTSLPLEEPTDETFDRLLVEPLCASKQIPMESASVWFDLGSGGGSPAIPLKMARPSLRLTMIESKERKAAFLREAMRMLGLMDAHVMNARFEDAAADPKFFHAGELVTVRAVRPDTTLFDAAGHLLAAQGRLLLFRPAHAASADPPGFSRMTTVPLIDAPQSFLSVYRRLS
jgi:16S rRNA (guanine527-N7)-methyltransferase